MNTLRDRRRARRCRRLRGRPRPWARRAPGGPCRGRAGRRPDVRPGAKRLTLALIDRAQVHRGSGPSSRPRRAPRCSTPPASGSAACRPWPRATPPRCCASRCRPTLRAALPAEVRDLVEETGRGHRRARGAARRPRRLGRRPLRPHAGHRRRARYALHFAGAAPERRPAASRTSAACASAPRSSSTGARDVARRQGRGLPNTTGPQKTLAILVTFSNAPSQPYTVALRREPALRHDQQLRARSVLPADDGDRRRRRLVHDRGDERQLRLRRDRHAGARGRAGRRPRDRRLPRADVHLPVDELLAGGDSAPSAARRRRRGSTPSGACRSTSSGTSSATTSASSTRTRSTAARTDRVERLLGLRVRRRVRPDGQQRRRALQRLPEGAPRLARRRRLAADHDRAGRRRHRDLRHRAARGPAQRPAARAQDPAHRPPAASRPNGSTSSRARRRASTGSSPATPTCSPACSCTRSSTAIPTAATCST